jgi:hypothetical protein
VSWMQQLFFIGALVGLSLDRLQSGIGVDAMLPFLGLGLRLAGPGVFSTRCLFRDDTAPNKVQ